MINKTGWCTLCTDELSIFKKKIYDTRFGIEGIYDIGMCNNCGLIQLKSHPSSLELKQLYETYYNFGGSKKAYTLNSVAHFWNLYFIACGWR